MHVVGQGLEARAVRGAGEAVHGGHEPAVFVHALLGEGLVGVGRGGGLVPLDVHHHVFPAVVLQVLSHVFGVLPDLGLVDGGAVAVPAVPAHGRILGNHELTSLSFKSG